MTPQETDPDVSVSVQESLGEAWVDRLIGKDPDAKKGGRRIEKKD